MRLWRVYRTDNESDEYLVWALVRDAAIRAAHVEHFGVVLLSRMLGAARL